MLLTCPVPRPETPSVQHTRVPAALKWRVQDALSLSLTMSTLFRTSTRGLAPHHLRIWEWHVDRGILHAQYTCGMSARGLQAHQMPNETWRTEMADCMSNPTLLFNISASGCACTMRRLRKQPEHVSCMPW